MPRVVTRSALLLLLWALLGACGPPAGMPPFARIRVGENTLAVEIAESAAERYRGLSGRTALAPERGMLFLYLEPHRPRFTMRDMQFDLDLVWIRGNRVIGVRPNASSAPASREHTYMPPAEVDAVLEVAAGTAARSGWERGTKVEFPWMAPPPSDE